MRDKLADTWQAAGPAKLGMLCQRLGLVAQIFAEALGACRVVLPDVSDDAVQVLAGHWSPFNTIVLGRHASFSLWVSSRAW